MATTRARQNEASRRTKPERNNLVTAFHGIRYQVADVARSVEFYTTHLGFSAGYQHLPEFAEVKIVFTPLERGEGYVFEDKTVGGSVPKEYVPSVDKGLKLQKEDGVLAHFPTVNGRVLDAQAHPLADHDVIDIAGVKMEFFFKA